jgi:hypothetical protein
MKTCHLEDGAAVYLYLAFMASDFSLNGRGIEFKNYPIRLFGTKWNCLEHEEEFRYLGVPLTRVRRDIASPPLTPWENGKPEPQILQDRKAYQAT